MGATPGDMAARVIGLFADDHRQGVPGGAPAWEVGLASIGQDAGSAWRGRGDDGGRVTRTRDNGLDITAAQAPGTVYDVPRQRLRCLETSQGRDGRVGMAVSGWPDSNRRPPAPKLNLVRQRGGLEESCRSTELGLCRQSVSRTFADSSSLGSPTGSPYRRYQNKHCLGGPRSDDRSQPVNWVAPVHQAATVTDGGFAVARVAGPR